MAEGADGGRVFIRMLCSINPLTKRELLFKLRRGGGDALGASSNSCRCVTPRRVALIVGEDDVRPTEGLKHVGGERERNWEERKRSSRVLKGWWWWGGGYVS